MSWLDDFKDVVNQGGASITRASRAAKAQFEISELEKQRKDLFEELGASLYYATREDENLRFGREMIYNQIAKIEHRREELVREVELSNGGAAIQSRVCAKCGKPLEEGAVFCSNCGTAVAEEEPAQINDSADEAQELVCPRCSHPLSKEDLFCPGCGTRL
jgi:uncharacterized Zn finger protein (UPF0148 family)